jgi:hypothetical protein
MRLTSVRFGKLGSQVWLSEEMEEYETHVRQAGDVRRLLACSYFVVLHTTASLVVT